MIENPSDFITEFKSPSPAEAIDTIKNDPRGFLLSKGIKNLIVEAIALCKDEKEFTDLVNFAEIMRYGYSQEKAKAREKYENLKNRFSTDPKKLSPEFISGEENKLVLMTGNHLKGAWGLLKTEVAVTGRYKIAGGTRFFLLQLHKENKTLNIGLKQGAQIIGTNPIEIYSALAGYLHEDRHNPFQTITAVNAMPDIRERIGLIVNDPRMTEGYIINAITPLVLKAL